MLKRVKSAIIAGLLLSNYSLASEELINKIEVVVNSNIINSSDIKNEETYIDNYLKAKNIQQYSNTWINRCALESLITRSLELDYAKSLNIIINKEELYAFIFNISKGNNVESYLSAAADKYKVPREYILKKISGDLISQKLKSIITPNLISISNNDVEESIKKLNTTEPVYSLSRIVFKLSQDDDANKSTRDTARKILNLINNNFESLAHIYSENSKEASNYGLLPPLNKIQLNNDLFKEINKLNIGSHTGLIEDENYIYIYKLNNKFSENILNPKQYKISVLALSINPINTLEKTKKRIHQILNSKYSFLYLVKKYSENYNKNPYWVREINSPTLYKMLIGKKENELTDVNLVNNQLIVAKIYEVSNKSLNDSERYELAKKYILNSKSEKAYLNWISSLRAKSYVRLTDYN